MSFLTPRASTPMERTALKISTTKLYCGVRQWHWGKWVAEIHLPKNAHVSGSELLIPLRKQLLHTTSLSTNSVVISSD
ncbi:hypothetical protein ZOSMA_694G00010 [Zostera marina]|uniref:AP2/ERF domain-containing protein n=1 Tax=Zostera marina TaxID=29655 RepID=A0A0K9NS33_ZOSMR|nr:hypothetical protein ZOSMA_694G00010 [Zostera marina]